MEALVADIKVDGILGLDFLKTNKCVVDVVSEKLVLGESEIFEGTLGLNQSLDQANEKIEVRLCVVADAMEENKNEQFYLKELQNKDKNLLYIKR